jgi:6-phosphofructokinase 1
MIGAANIEASSVMNGVGLVKLMGRYSGFIAM